MESWRTDTDQQRGWGRTVATYLENLQANVDAGIGLSFYGSPGIGKSMLAAIIARGVIALRLNAEDRGEHSKLTVCFKREDLIFVAIKKAWDEPEREQMVMNRFCHSSLLIIDDFGKRKPSEYVIEKWHAIFDTRWNFGRPTIITANYNREMLVDDYEAQIDRLAGNIELEAVADSMRGKV